MAGETDPTLQTKKGCLGTPFDSTDRDGKKAPNGPVDPVAVWRRARELCGLSDRLGDDEERVKIRAKYAELCIKITQSSEASVVGDLDSPNDVTHRWDWRKARQAPEEPKEGEMDVSVYTSKPLDGEENVVLGEAGNEALGGEVRTVEPTEAA